jgi:N-acetylmuramoyl-L-alanine amidase
MLRFPAESSLVAEVVPSPNHGERGPGTSLDMILLHYTGMPDANVALERLCSPQSEVSAHYVVFEDGRVIQCVPEGRRAWHAGQSCWAGQADINSCSIGIEIANPGHDFGYPDFPRRQIAAVIALCRGIIARRRVPADRVLAHSDVAPARKRDPGEKFPWQLLHESGVGHWVRPAPITDGARLAAGDHGESVGVLQSGLAQYGYDLPVTGVYDAATVDVVTAFQRHFRPARCDGIADESTTATLRALLAERPQRAVPTSITA